MNRILFRWLVVLLGIVGLGGCGYNDFQRLDEQVGASWSEVLNQYQRRADLIPNIVNTVKGEANFEQETLTRVIEARAKATSIQATPELVNDPQAFERFQAAQGELSSALSRLIAVSENYPNLKANQGFQDCASSLRGRRTASPWHATATSSRWPNTTCSPGVSRPTSRQWSSTTTRSPTSRCRTPTPSRSRQR